MTNAASLIEIQNLATRKGKLERDYVAASQSQRIILRIQINHLAQLMILASRPLRDSAWRM